MTQKEMIQQLRSAAEMLPGSALVALLGEALNAYGQGPEKRISVSTALRHDHCVEGFFLSHGCPMVQLYWQGDSDEGSLPVQLETVVKSLCPQGFYEVPGKVVNEFGSERVIHEGFSIDGDEIADAVLLVASFIENDALKMAS